MIAPIQIIGRRHVDSDYISQSFFSPRNHECAREMSLICHRHVSHADETFKTTTERTPNQSRELWFTLSRVDRVNRSRGGMKATSWRVSSRVFMTTYGDRTIPRRRGNRYVYKTVLTITS